MGQPWKMLRTSLRMMSMVDGLGSGQMERGLTAGPVLEIAVGRLWPQQWLLLLRRGLWPPPM